MAITIQEKRYGTIKAIAIGGGILALFLALMLTGMYACILNQDIANCMKVEHMLQAFKEIGFPYQFFLLMLTVFMGVVGYGCYLRYKVIENTDILGRYNFAKAKGDNEADFAGPKDFKKDLKDICLIQPIEEARGFIYGTLDEAGKKVVNYKMDDGDDFKKKNGLPNTNVMCVGESGIGKGVSVTGNQILQACKERHSFIVTDPSLENYRRFAPFLEAQGYRVWLFSPNKPEISDQWNCLNNETTAIDLHASFLSRAIIENAPGYENNSSSTICRNLLRAVILLVLTDPYRDNSKKTLNEVMDILLQPGGREYLDELFSSTQLVLPDQIDAQRAYQTFKQSSANYGGNIFSDLSGYLELLQISKIREIFGGEDISFVELCSRPCALFAGIPAGMKTSQYSQLVAMLFTMAFSIVYDFAEKQPDGKSPVHVDFICDEAAAIGRIPNFANILETVRKYNVSVYTIFQDLSQFQTIYGDQWNSIFNNSATKIILGTSDTVTPEIIEKFIGDTLVENESEKIDAGESVFNALHDKTQSSRVQSLLPAALIRRLDTRLNIVLFSHQKPVLLYKFLYFNHPWAAYLGEPRRIEDIPDISDKEGRKHFREWQDRVIEAYYYNTKDDNKRTYKELWLDKAPAKQKKSKKNPDELVKKQTSPITRIKSRLDQSRNRKLDEKATKLNENAIRRQVMTPAADAFAKLNQPPAFRVERTLKVSHYGENIPDISKEVAQTETVRTEAAAPTTKQLNKKADLKQQTEQKTQSRKYEQMSIDSHESAVKTFASSPNEDTYKPLPIFDSQTGAKIKYPLGYEKTEENHRKQWEEAHNQVQVRPLQNEDNDIPLMRIANRQNQTLKQETQKVEQRSNIAPAGQQPSNPAPSSQSIRTTEAKETPVYQEQPADQKPNEASNSQNHTEWGAAYRREPKSNATVLPPRKGRRQDNT